MQQYEWDEYEHLPTSMIVQDMVAEELADLERRRGKAGSRTAARNILLYHIVLVFLIGLWVLIPQDFKPYGLLISLFLIIFYYKFCYTFFLF